MTFSPVIAGTEPYMQIRRQMRPLAASGKGTPPDSDQEAGSADLYYKRNNGLSQGRNPSLFSQALPDRPNTGKSPDKVHEGDDWII